MNKQKWVQSVAYRLGQVRQQLGFVAPLSAQDRAEVVRWLPSQAILLFEGMSVADQQHCLRVCRNLQADGCEERDLLAAALLHDVGKGEGRVPFWTRPAIVIGKRYAPQLLSRLTVYPRKEQSLPSWRRSLSYAWWHAEVGADLSAAAGLSEQAVLYIRSHHQPDGPAAQLHKVDEAS